MKTSDMFIVFGIFDTLEIAVCGVYETKEKAEERISKHSFITKPNPDAKPKLFMMPVKMYEAEVLHGIA